MGSVIPFQDLNRSPEFPVPRPSPSSVGIGSTSTLVCPKIEVKTEPLDEPPGLQRQNQNSNLSPGFRETPIPEPAGLNFCSQHVSNHTPLQSVPPLKVDNDDSEFTRVSKMVDSAFGQMMQQYSELNSDSGAIVAVPSPSENTDVGTASAKRQKRSGELVRVSNLTSNDQRCFREVLRRTRMLYDSLRLYTVVEEEKKIGYGMGRRVRGDLKAATLMRDSGLWLNLDKRIVGSIPGVFVGDVFFFRMELCVVGLHGLPQAGIDYLTSSLSPNGHPIATSIIVSGGYEDDEDSGDVLIYTGQGGQDKFGRQCSHQRLETGNLAMEKSMHFGIEVRVIRGIKYEGAITAKVYVYDGLYKIVDMWFDVGKSGFGVYKFKVVRIPGQPVMGSTILRYAQTLRRKPLQLRPKGYLTLDLSRGKESTAVFLYNDIDSDHEPLRYEYLEKPVFPPFIYHSGTTQGSGCTCVGGCAFNCFCWMKNGREIDYDQNGLLLRGKPVIFECGPSCLCPLECPNRVSQRGLRHRLEVFRSRETEWGVRTLDLIVAGSFICEYTGIILTKEQAQILSMSEDTLIYPGRFAARWADWGDLTQVFPDYVRTSSISIPPLEIAMDVSRMRNVACYVSHSSCPNVMVQFVLYDHNNMMFPHIMLFALENIPPMKELSIDYGVADEYSGKLALCN